jgi:putative peptidoglycan lipid II flippase
VASTLRSSAGVSVAVLASRVLGLVRESLFAAVFGVGWLADAYVIAFRIPNLLRDLFAEGALSSAFVPTFSEALQKGGPARAYRLGNLIVSGLILVTGGLSLLGIIYAREVVWLISLGFRGTAPELVPAKMAESILLARIMMPILMLVSLSAVWMGMLNAQHRYGAPAIAPALFNVVNIACGLMFYVWPFDQAKMLVIFAASTTLAGLVQGLAQLPSLWRLGYRPRLSVLGIWRDPDVRRILRLMAPAIIGLAAVQVNVFVNTQFASALKDGSNAILNYAFRLFYLPIGIFGVAVATVTTARASADAARGDRAAMADRVAEGSRGVWLLALPSAVGLMVLAEPIAAVLFQRRAFSAADTAAIAPVVQAYMLGVLPYSLVKVLSPAYYALNRPRIPMIASMCAVAANLTFNALTYRRLGVAGLALGTTLAALVNLFILRVTFSRVVGPLPRAGWARELASLVLATAVLGAVAWGGWHGAAVILAHLHGLAPRLVGWVRALLLFADIAVAFLAYVGVLRALGHPGARELWRIPGRILGRFRRR